jgi:hypothetical protein
VFTVDRRSHDSADWKAKCHDGVAHRHERSVALGVVANNSLVHVAFADLELRFDQDDIPKVGTKSRDERRQNHCDRNEADVNDHIIDGADLPSVNELARQISGVRAFDDVDAKIRAKRGMELAVSDIQCDYPPSATEQGNLGEPAGGRTNVKNSATTEVNAESLTRAK